MKKYQWNNEKLQKRANLYNGLVLAFGSLALLIYFVGMGSNTTQGLLVCLGLTGGCYLMWWRTQSQDKKLKPKE